VVAIAIGFDGQLRQVGDEFEMQEGSKGSWFVPVELPEPQPAPPARTSKRPVRQDEPIA